jgi:hypothetical protein
MRLSILTLSTLALSAVGISGCATPIHPDAHPVVIVAHAPDDPACRALGDVTGSQGNWFTGMVTANADLTLGARNDLKNNVHHRGGNLVTVPKPAAIENGLFGYSKVTYSGQAYKCPSWN